MIAVETVYDTLLTMIREDKRGLSLSPDEYTRIANLVNEQVYAKKYAEYEKTLSIGTALSTFMSSAPNVALIGNTAVLPSDYKIMIGKPYSYSAARYMDYVTMLELHERTEDYLTKYSTTYPLWTYIGEAGGVKLITVYPATITGQIWIRYLREATAPFYDYYVNDTTAKITYMDVDANVVIPSGSTYRSGTAGDGVTSFASLSEDWEWGIDEFHLILSIFAEKMGIALPDNFLVEAGNLEETKAE